MSSRLVKPYCVAETRLGGRTIAIVILTIIAIASFTGLASLAAIDHDADQAWAEREATARATAETTEALGRQQRAIDQLARIAATATDAAAQQLLDQLPSLATGVRAAALADPSGVVQLRSADQPNQAAPNQAAVDETALAGLAAAAAREAATHPDAAMLVTPTMRAANGGTAIVALAQPWHDADGRLGGIALVAIDRTAFAGLDLVRSDGSPLFAEGRPADVQLLALGDFPMMLRYPAAARTETWPFVAIAGLDGAALVSLVALLLGRLRAAAREIARRAAVEDCLRENLVAAAAAADATDELSRTKSQFFAQVTHELRTPLNAILGFSEATRQEIFGPVANPRYLEYAGLIHDAGGHLLSLINDLLDNARIEAGKMEIVPIRVSAAALARSALDLVELLAEDRHIALTISGLSTCPDLDVDPRAMKQVLVNLLSNAIKYTPPGGRVDVRFAMCADGSAAIEIADTGIGMSAEDLRVAFEPFGRAGALEARRQQGTGLGLSLARALTRLHRGDLLLTSRLNAGTTATVILPATAVFARMGNAVTSSAQAA
jgi:signal transduction histidine kinase